MTPSKRYGILSDVHANEQALNVALETLREEGVDEYLILGDLIGYNASPSQVMDTLLDLEPAYYISGNHDRYLTGETKLTGISRLITDIIDWTREELTERQLTFLEELRTEQTIDDEYLIVHGSPRHEDEYILSLNLMQKNLDHLSEHNPNIQVCFFGHTHVPLVFSGESLDTDFHEDREIHLEPDQTHLVNVGSVGQPRDGCSKSAFGLFDAETNTLKVFRRSYDVQTEKRRISNSPVDRTVALRLEEGR